MPKRKHDARLTPLSISRREALRRGFFGLGMLAAGPTFYGCGGKEPDRRVSAVSTFGPLRDADTNGLRTPSGFRSRIIARSGEVLDAATNYVWHDFPDGGAVFSAADGGWIYVSNSENDPGLGGVGAVRFDANANVIDAYPILRGTRENCAGGPTPWGTWLSCEEFSRGMVWECDPFGEQAAVERPALGVFRHEAAAIEPVEGHVYLTEDEPDGGFYRFVPSAAASGGRLDLESGELQIARVVGDSREGAVEWLTVPDPQFAGDVPTRLQVAEHTPFIGGEGLWYGNGVLYFTTKGDNRVWSYEVESSLLSVLYDDDTAENPILSGVDNVTVSAQGDVLVAEDGGDMQIVALAPTGEIVPVVQIVGHAASEVAGPAFDPSGTRLYFSSQRGEGVPPSGGITYEISGPFFF